MKKIWQMMIVPLAFAWLLVGCSKKESPSAPTAPPAPVDDARARMVITQAHLTINEMDIFASKSLKSQPDTTKDFWKPFKGLPFISYSGYYLSDNYWRRYIKAKYDTSNYRVDTMLYNPSQTPPLRKFKVSFDLNILKLTRYVNIGNNTVPPAAAGVVNRIDWEKDSVIISGQWSLLFNRDSTPADTLIRDSSITVDSLLRQACWGGYTLSTPGDTFRLNGAFYSYDKATGARWECQWQQATRGASMWSGYHRKNPAGTINYTSYSTSTLTGSFTFPGDTTTYVGTGTYQVGTGISQLGSQKIADYYFNNHGFGYYKVASSGDNIIFDW